jgi:hypothetical protein
MNPASLLPLILFRAGAHTQSPSVTLPGTIENGNICIQVAAANEAPQKFSLCPLYGQSMVRSTSRQALAGLVPLAANTVSLGSVEFSEPTDDVERVMPPKTAGILCRDFLKGKAFGIDAISSTVTIWPSGLTSDEAATWMSQPPEWKTLTGKRVQVIPISHDNGAYTVPIELGKATAQGLLSLQYGSTAWLMQDSAAAKIPGLNGGIESTASRIKLGERTVHWPVLSTVTDPWWAISGTKATIDPQLFVRPRCIYDFSKNKLYTESYSPDGELSVALTIAMRVPLVVSGDKILLDPIPGMTGTADVSAFSGSEVLRIEGLETPELLKALRSDKPEDAQKITQLFGLGESGYDIHIRKPDGTTMTLNIQQGG